VKFSFTAHLSVFIHYTYNSKFINYKNCRGMNIEKELLPRVFFNATTANQIDFSDIKNVILLNEN
jgi:hypothetical protein